MDFILENWAEIALAIIAAAGTITALTETEKDDNIVDLLQAHHQRRQFSDVARNEPRRL